MKKDLVKIPIQKIIFYLLIIIAILFFLHTLSVKPTDSTILNKDSIEYFIQKTGIFAPIAYILLVALVALSPISSSVLGVIAGYVFNPFLAIVLTFLGEMFGAIVNFYIGKKIIGYLLKNNNLKFVSNFINKYKDRLKPSLIFVLGMIPVGTSNLTAYAAGLSGVKLKNYLVPWMSGITVLSLFTIFLGHSAEKSSPFVSGAIIIFAVFVILFLIKTFSKLEEK